MGRTELGELGASFNQMTDQVERFVGDLQRSAEENHELFLGTVKALAAAMKQLAADPAAARAMGETGRDLAEKHYNVTRYSNDLHRFFESL